VVDALIDSLKNTPGWDIEETMAEKNAAAGFAKRRCSPASVLDLEYREHRGTIKSTTE
jgi:hypothetical protein